MNFKDIFSLASVYDYSWSFISFNWLLFYLIYYDYKKKCNLTKKIKYFTY